MEEANKAGAAPAAPTPEAQAPTPEPNQDKIPEPKVLFYILSFVVGLFGIIFGAIYMSKDDAEVKKFGKICLLLGLIPTLLSCLCCAVYYILILTGALAGGEWSTY